MKKMFFYRKKSAFLLFASIGICIAIICSFCKKDKSKEVIPEEDIPPVCNGAFYRTNIQGTGFGISFPSTGAPGEPHSSFGSYWTTCHSCHSSYPLNSGSGDLTIDFNDSVTEYVPGQTYTVTVTLSQAPSDFLYFQLTNRDVNNDSVLAVGNFIITDKNKTRLIDSSMAGGGGFGGPFLGLTKYVASTACGTDAISAGFNKWSFNWKAPEKAGTVTFYIGATASNNDDQTTGDYVYLKAVQLKKK